MIKHIVFWRLKDEGRDANKKVMKERLLALKGKVPGIVEFEVGDNFNENPFAYELALYSTFKTRDDLKTYQAHPDHQAVAAFVKEVTKDRAVVDYEV